ncbi:MAG: VOC family protein [Bacteroidota bacterium]
MKFDPIIAVQDVVASSKWYQSVLGCKSKHGGDEFDILVDEEGEVVLCLHKWGEHGHPSMLKSNIRPGNGLILYLRTTKLELIRQQLKEMGHPVEREIQLNPNSHHKEFSVVDPNGYYLTISDFHQFGG